MSYEDHIAALLNAQMAPDSTDENLCRLLGALGCRYVAGIPSDNMQLITPSQPGDAHEALIARTLSTLLHDHLERFIVLDAEHCYSIMDGLCRNKRWRTCLTSSVQAADLATLLIHYSHVGPNCADGRRLLTAVEPHACDLLKEWLDIDVPYAEPPGNLSTATTRSVTYLLAQALYGDVWCSLAIEDMDDRTGGVPGLIRAQNPPVQQHLLSAAARPTAEELPAMGIV
jgi:hypothetical protein